jgi:hypothetical protein
MEQLRERRLIARACAFPFRFSASFDAGQGIQVCGPSHDQETLFGNSQALSTLMAANFNQRFADQSELINSLRTVMTPIVNAGPDQQGMGPQELAALKTQSGESVGQNYAKATAALNNQLAVRGGGAGDVTSGAEGQLKSELASAAAAQSSNEDLAITKANYDLGRQNWLQATAGLNALVGETNPGQLGSLSLDANKNAFGEATQIQDMKNQEEASIAGGVTALAGGFLDFANSSDFMGQLGGGKIFGPGGVFGGPAVPSAPVYGMNNSEAVG